MWRRWLTIRSDDPIRVTQGRLLLAATFSIGVAALAYIPFAFFIPPPWLVPMLVVFVGICFGITLLARAGHVPLAGALFTLVILIMIPTATPTENLLNGPIGMVFLFPMLVAGVTIGAWALFGVGTLAIAILLALVFITNQPWNDRIVPLVLMILMFGLLLSMILQSLNSALRQALNRSREAETAHAALMEREADLVQTQHTLVTRNQDLERLFALVQELEVPMIPVREDMMVVPLVGHMDTRRSEHLTTTVLHGVSQQRIKAVIIDMSGVLVIDTVVLQHLYELAQSIRLIGSQVFITGLSAQMAATIAQLGIDFSWMHIARSVQDVLATDVHF